MQKELSEKIKFPKTDLELLPKNSGVIAYSDVLGAVRLASLPEEKLSKQIVFASVVGALRGFQERDLKPFHANHKYIFRELSLEILNMMKIFGPIDQISNEERIKILKDSFEFGIRKVYHLEWKLYTSREIY
ncbi:LIC_11502 family protein [Leptospira adleri]|uniref:Uncharacterized protein n=1 Tax=Leptospira adleri TaxID=2023186 RepID=A0A2M9YM17_9LEPT|nr:hypothetical protein [Leptospira adleri]PJZ52585.1 hypothetical protein CH380_14080 [Leptospira adleri]PJZ60042.1 hypothetical protein CH376_20585 [Leptospira adleri]